MRRKETYTRAEVESLLSQMCQETESFMHTYYQREAEIKLPPLWLAVTIISTGVLILWILAIWG